MGLLRRVLNGLTGRDPASRKAFDGVTRAEVGDATGRMLCHILIGLIGDRTWLELQPD